MTGPRLGDRSLFPDLQARAYLAHAAISPPSLLVQRAIEARVADCAARGLGAFGDWMRDRQTLVADLARLCGGRGEDYALVANTSVGVLDIALSIDWRPGDRIVLFRGEFPANVIAWQQAAERHGLAVTWLDCSDFATDPGLGLAALEGVLRSGVRLVAVSAVQFQTGLRMPVAAMGALCRAHGAELFVDGIQAVGVVPIDVVADGIDYLACGGHKWAMGPEGTGFLYVAPQRVGQLHGVVSGWLSVEEPLDFIFDGPGLLRYDKPLRKSADAFELGMANSVGFSGLAASVATLLELGVGAIYEHVVAYNRRLRAGLIALGFEPVLGADPATWSGILSVRPPAPASAAQVAAALNEGGIVVTGPDGLLRFAPHWPNAHEEVELVLDAVAEVCAPLRQPNPPPLDAP